MSMQTRGLVFATFFGNCLVVGLLVASLTTDWWVHAQAKRRHSGGNGTGTMVLLFVSNCASAISQMLAFVCWLVQFYEYLTHNVLTLADRNENAWYSTGMSQLGHSFYFLGAAIVIVLINLLLLTMAVRLERQERRRNRHDDPAYDEKQQGAIMLY